MDDDELDQSLIFWGPVRKETLVVSLQQEQQEQQYCHTYNS